MHNEDLSEVEECNLNSSTSSVSTDVSKSLSSHISSTNLQPGLQRSVSSPSLRNSREFYYKSFPDSDVKIPIVGYEVMEERAKFTVYKLRIENKMFAESWFVFRRYTDFVRLHSKLKTQFPKLCLVLPRKRWLGNNFELEFIEKRVKGLQKLIDEITGNEELLNCDAVKEFFCLDQPPTYMEADEESRAIFESLEETIFQLRKHLFQQEKEFRIVRAQLEEAQKFTDEMVSKVRKILGGCSNCKDSVEAVLDSLELGKEISSYDSDMSSSSNKVNTPPEEV